jgi:hypothetical protein
VLVYILFNDRKHRAMRNVTTLDHASSAIWVIGRPNRRLIRVCWRNAEPITRRGHPSLAERLGLQVSAGAELVAASFAPTNVRIREPAACV